MWRERLILLHDKVLRKKKGILRSKSLIGWGKTAAGGVRRVDRRRKRML